MKTMLSIPRTISSAASVRNAIQACGSVIQSMRQLSGEGAGRGRRDVDRNSAGQPRAGRRPLRQQGELGSVTQADSEPPRVTPDGAGSAGVSGGADLLAFKDAMLARSELRAARRDLHPSGDLLRFLGRFTLVVRFDVHRPIDERAPGHLEPLHNHHPRGCREGTAPQVPRDAPAQRLESTGPPSKPSDLASPRGGASRRLRTANAKGLPSDCNRQTTVYGV